MNKLLYFFGGGCNDSDSSAFITATGITDPTIKNAICLFVKELKSQNLWGKLAVIYPFVGGTAATHAVNLKNPGTFDATFFSGIVHSANGVQGDATSAYYSTNHLPSFLATHNLSTGVYANVISVGRFDVGQASGANNRVGVKIRDGNAPNYSLFGCIFGGTEQGHGSNIVANGFGFFAIGRINDAQTFGVVKNATITVNKAYVGKVNSVILGLRSGTTYSSSRHAFFYVGYDMITTELVALKNCVNTLQTNLGRNVH